MLHKTEYNVINLAEENRLRTYHDRERALCSQTAQNPLQPPGSIATDKSNKLYKRRIKIAGAELTLDIVSSFGATQVQRSGSYITLPYRCTIKSQSTLTHVVVT